MKFLIDECLHNSLVAIAEARGHQGTHVVWMGWRGAADWDLMPRIVTNDFTFVTNNARDFRRLFARAPLHAGLVIIVPQVAPPLQRELFDGLLAILPTAEWLLNEVIEITLADGEAIFTRYPLPPGEPVA